jgi:hypothetical protein
MRRTLTAATSVLFPLAFAMLIGGFGTFVDLVLTAWIAKPWAMESAPSWQVIGLLILLGLGAPIGYFVLGWSYGMGRAIFRVYLSYREAVAELVIEGTDPDDWARDKPVALRRVMKIVLMLAGAGDRLQDAVGEGKPRVEIVAAILDDLLYARLAEPPRNLLIVLAVVNVLCLAGLWYAVR